MHYLSWFDLIPRKLRVTQYIIHKVRGESWSAPSSVLCAFHLGHVIWGGPLFSPLQNTPLSADAWDSTVLTSSLCQKGCLCLFEALMFNEHITKHLPLKGNVMRRKMTLYNLGASIMGFWEVKEHELLDVFLCPLVCLNLQIFCWFPLRQLFQTS